MRVLIIFLLVIIKLFICSFNTNNDCDYNGNIRLNIIADTLYSIILEGDEECFPNYVFKYISVKRMDIHNCKYNAFPVRINEMNGLNELYISECYLLDYNKLMKVLLHNNLKIISLRDNGISEIPYEIWNLHTLEEIKLSSNKITSVTNEIFQLKNLQYLDLSENIISNLDHLSDLNYSIIYLNLSGNNLKKIPSGLENLKKLKRLVLSDNPELEFEDILEYLEIIDELDVLEVSGCKPIKNIPENIDNLKKVNIITIAKNVFAKEVLDKIRDRGIKIN